MDDCLQSFFTLHNTNKAQKLTLQGRHLKGTAHLLQKKHTSFLKAGQRDMQTGTEFIG